jgi:malate dehydrogenase (oxaloacetate-decarboxylating)
MVQAVEPTPPPGEKRRVPPHATAEEEGQTEALGERAVRLAEFYHGKIETVPRVPVRSLADFSLWYTPGIAAVCRRIEKDPAAAFDLTGRWNTIAIVTDGSRVLGLGNIGPQAALPVMEGKALLFKSLGGVDAVPIPVQTETPEELVETVMRLAPAFGGINLEDIASPKCFYVLEELQKRLPIPVWHDDQLGTAAATVAALLNALELTGRSIREARTVLLGAGAANLVTARLLFQLGHDPHRLTAVDQHGILHAEREDVDELSLRNRWKFRLALDTNGGGRTGGLTEALEGADVLLAASTPDPNTVRPAMIRSMAPKPIVFALANPTPEIWPSVAHDAGAAVVATGRSDFPNQVNNSLVFPGVFRGILDARATSLPDAVVLAAARELAARARDKGLTATHLLPTMDEIDAFPHVAAAVAGEAARLGIARRRRTHDEYYQEAKQMMARSHALARELVRAGFVAPMPDEPRNEPK